MGNQATAADDDQFCTCCFVPILSLGFIFVMWLAATWVAGGFSLLPRRVSSDYTVSGFAWYPDPDISHATEMMMFTLIGVAGVVFVLNRFGAKLGPFIAWPAICAIPAFVAICFDSIGASSGIWGGTPPLAVSLFLVGLFLATR